MSVHIPAALARAVHRRAGNICEYCGLPQSSQEATFHVDHIEPRADGGPTELSNLALACVTCSIKKAAASPGARPPIEAARAFVSSPPARMVRALPLVADLALGGPH